MSGLTKWMEKLKAAEKTCIVSDGKFILIFKLMNSFSKRCLADL